MAVQHRTHSLHNMVGAIVALLFNDVPSVKKLPQLPHGLLGELAILN